jgi:methyltransferase-like protein
MEKETKNELPNPADFMQLGEDAFNKNVHEKLRETLSPIEKQMWINGYLLALTEQNKR